MFSLYTSKKQKTILESLEGSKSLSLQEKKLKIHDLIKLLKFIHDYTGDESESVVLKKRASSRQ